MPVERADRAQIDNPPAPVSQGVGSPFIHQLRALYQRSIRARELAQRSAAVAAMRNRGSPTAPQDPEEPCPMTTDDEAMDEADAAIAVAAAAAARIGRGPAPQPVRLAAANARAGAERQPGARPLSGNFGSLLLPNPPVFGAPTVSGSEVAAAAAAVARGRFRSWGSDARLGGGMGPAAMRRQDYADEDVDDDDDCPGLLDEDDESEEEDSLDETEAAGMAADRAYAFSWRRMLVPRGVPAGDGHARNVRRRMPQTAEVAEAAGQAAAQELPVLVAPQPCSFLRPGVRFSGVQRLSHQLPTARRQDDWGVTVLIEGVDHEAGTVCGTMQAINVPGAGGAPIVTWWEGHIIDDVRHTFFTRSAGHGPGATPGREVDLKHWGKFEGFTALRADVVRHGGRSGALERHPYIYMRWKEQFFVGAGQDVGLTIAGFYYIALCRLTGRVKGFYYDPHSSPFQALELEPVVSNTCDHQHQQQQQQAAAQAPELRSGGGFVFTSHWKHC